MDQLLKVKTRKKTHEKLLFISHVEPKSVDEAWKDNYWILEMKEELDQIVKNETWGFFPRSKYTNVIGTN